MSRTEVTAAEIRDAIPGYLAEHDGALELWRAYDGLRRQLGLDWPQTSRSAQLQLRFNGQVRRALDAMAASGELRKVGLEGTGPDGYQFDRHGAEPRYFTPGAYKRAVQLDKDAKATRQDVQERWQVIHARLAALGVASTEPGATAQYVISEEPHLSQHDWERLLELAGERRHG
jgi:hypothetical protein